MRLGSAVLLSLGLLTLAVNAVGVPLANQRLPGLAAQAGHVLQREVRPAAEGCTCSSELRHRSGAGCTVDLLLSQEE